MAEFNKDGLGNILFVAVAVCLVCSVFVSAANVSLKPQQQRNKELDQKENILRAAGLLEAGKSVGNDGRGVDELTENSPLVGTPSRIADRLGAFRDAGVQRIYLQLLDIDDLDHLELFADAVIGTL